VGKQNYLQEYKGEWEDVASSDFSQDTSNLIVLL